MSALSPVNEIADHVCDRLEEDRANPKQWNRVDEIHVAIVDVMREAALLTGEPEERAAAAYTLAKDQAFYPNPPEAIALLRLESDHALPVRRVTIADLDQMIPEWQSHTGTSVKYWFPFGMTRFGVYPRLQEEVQVIATYVRLPVITPRPYSGNEEIPFQEEYLHGIESGAAHGLRIKETGLEFRESMDLYNDFLKAMQDLGRFAARKSSIRFTRRGGVPARVTEKERM